MKTLTWQPPTAEQLKIIGETRTGTEVVRGAAGSGKTTTALLRLRNLSDFFESRFRRMGVGRHVRILVLTYNRTLCGFVHELAASQTAVGGHVIIDVDTFAHWALANSGSPALMARRCKTIQSIAAGCGVRLDPDFVCSEVEYVLGRFPEDRIDEYLDVERRGRGLSPRVDRNTRQLLLETIQHYKQHLATTLQVDWEDLPTRMQAIPCLEYDIIIVDEAQDFSANQLRAVQHHLSHEYALTLVIDTAQRLYPRGYTWAEAGLTKVRFHQLKQNHRNTVEVAAFAKGVIQNMALDDDGTLPDLERATRHGPLPKVISGRYSKQLDYAVNYIRSNIDLKRESVAFLKPKGGRWFDALRERLEAEGLDYEEITREKEWPSGDANIVLCTMHSAKGLEFDHVIILGLSAEVTQHGDASDDDQLDTLRRLLAMAIARARETVIVGYKPNEESDLVAYFTAGSYEDISL